MYGCSVDMPADLWEIIASQGGYPGARSQPWMGGVLVVTPSVHDAEQVLALAYLFSPLGKDSGAYIL